MTTRSTDSKSISDSDRHDETAPLATGDQSDLANKPGTILKAARDEMRLSLDQVADELHLRASIVAQMEAEQYEEFSSEVFLKGYFRSYCRLVGLHEERMTELLEKQLKQRKDAINSETELAHKRQQRQSQARYLKLALVFALVLAGSVFILSMFVPMNGQQAQQADAEAIKQADVRSESDAHAGRDQVNGDLASSDEAEGKVVGNSVDKNTSSKLSGTALKQEVQPVTSETQATSAEPQVVVITSDQSQNQMLEQASSVSVATSKSITRQAGITNDGQGSETDLAEGVINVEFTADCWFQLTDGRGKKVFSSLKRAGDQVSYVGHLPYQLVFGDARVASVLFKGEAVDLSTTMSRNGRAELVLE